MKFLSFLNLKQSRIKEDRMGMIPYGILQSITESVLLLTTEISDHNKMIK